MAEETVTATSSGSTGGGRSVSYPFITLEQAVARTKVLWDKEGKNRAYVSAVVGHWEYGPKSSGGKQTVAALKAFGLIEVEGASADRQIRLTERALDILIEPDPARKLKALQDAAVAPKIYSEMLNKWSASELPSDATISAYLLREKEFNRNAVEGFIKDFKANIRYAKLADSGNIPQKTTPLPALEKPSLQVGSYIQWTPGGVDQFVEPRRVTGFSDSKDFLFVEDSQTGVPVGEVTLMQAPVAPPAPPAAPPMVGPHPPVKPAPTGSRQDTFTLDEGVVILQWPVGLSAASFEDFDSWIQLQLKKIKRSVTN